ncbi:hypothetical protein DFJ74DRAFT_695510 [Hyaloraphidium curvatum]|nr:hypothetical protein DFJ74DRAFT_695510 [Hyaloraphidium curvatum]
MAALVPADIAPVLNRVATALRTRGDTIAVAESSAGGLLSAYLLSVPGASAYYAGGAVLYSLASRKAWVGWTDDDVKAYVGPTVDGARGIAKAAMEKLNATWGIGEAGVAGPAKQYKSGLRDAGYACFSVVGPVEKGAEYESKVNDRAENMVLFAKRALELLDEALTAAPKKVLA